MTLTLKSTKIEAHDPHAECRAYVYLTGDHGRTIGIACTVAGCRWSDLKDDERTLMGSWYAHSVSELKVVVADRMESPLDRGSMDLTTLALLAISGAASWLAPFVVAVATLR